MSNTGKQRKMDVFAVCLACFIELNCVSYFIRSDGSDLLRDKSDFLEIIGFPFTITVVGGIQGLSVFYWGGLVANLFISIALSCVIAVACTHKQPLALRKLTVSTRYPLKCSLALIVCLTVFLGMAHFVPRLGGVFYNIVRFLGPVAAGGIWLWGHHTSRSWLLVSGASVFFAAVVLDPRFSLLGWIAWHDAIILIHAFVPVAGILCAIVLCDALFRFLRERKTATF